jgi:hypothetical protein
MKKRRPGTRSKPKGRLPSDLADAAEAALDDMLSRTQEDEPEILDEEPRTQTRAPSEDDDILEDDDDEDDEILTVANRPAKLPLPAPPRTTSVQVVSRTTPHPHLTSRASGAPSRPTPTGPPTPAPKLRVPVDEPSRRAPIDETSPVPDEMILDLQSAPVALPPLDLDGGRRPLDLDDALRSDLIDAIEPASGTSPESDVPPLQVVVFEDSAHLGSAQSAISAAGHILALGGSGRDGVPRAIEAIAEGEVDVVVAALPGGERVIDAALAVEPHRPVVIASLGGLPLDAIGRAQRAGADLALTRPHSLESIAPILLAASRLHLERRVASATRGPGLDDGDPEARALVGYDVFERLLETEIKRARRYDYALSLALFALAVDAPAPPSFITGILRARAGNALIHALRDIDIATQVEHDRFVVLLPYTDLKAAAALGRRVIAAVAKADPVFATGRSFPLRLVGAIAGSPPGQVTSAAKLMKDATRTLEQARRDGAELAVQP